MDYSKAQMVSVDAGLGTLPAAFVTVTKRTPNLGAVDVYGNILGLEPFQRNRTHMSAHVAGVQGIFF